jgi:hypothetical protein
VEVAVVLLVLVAVPVDLGQALNLQFCQEQVIRLLLVLAVVVQQDQLTQHRLGVGVVRVQHLQPLLLPGVVGQEVLMELKTV